LSVANQKLREWSGHVVDLFCIAVVVLGVTFALGPPLVAMHLTFADRKAERLSMVLSDAPNEILYGVCRYCGEGESDIVELGEVHYRMSIDNVA
jgi:hypothetical protein